MEPEDAEEQRQVGAMTRQGTRHERAIRLPSTAGPRAAPVGAGLKRVHEAPCPLVTEPLPQRERTVMTAATSRPILGAKGRPHG